ncbi:hypothetical protein HUG10_20615 (plasmid) [Halorarum halophilum]|uniref:Uncharacterized protein n=1 Tax=Halorarum halophilum TaxID=2743090 RepID=A0A7D5GET8_9EURY|nr:hypothetical protein [Halobaculum halophilum]QLG30012.1 hypothetical protein HUG10_20615 [Halobaculum halophilum]
MSKQDEPWIRYPFDEMHRCMVCRKKTQSHAFPADVDDETFVLSDAPDPEFAFTVCHTCYTEHTPQDVLDLLNARYDELSERTGTTFTDFDRALSDEASSDRIKVFTNDRARVIIDHLDQGAVVEINEDREWVLVGNPEDGGDTEVEVVWGLVERRPPGNNGRGGAITKSSKPLDSRYMIAYQNGDGLDFEPIETVEVMG